MATINYVIKNNFQPFSFQERLAPYVIYKDAYDKAEEKYYQMKDRADKFKYLSKTLPEGSEAREIYETFARDLEEKSQDLIQHGLTMGTKSAITSLRGRIQGEIGMLEMAKEALEEERKVRAAKMAQDPSMKYATKDLTIDQFLYDRRPNLWSVSTDELYKRGLVAGQSSSSRVYSNGESKTLGEYYFDFMERVGWKPEGKIAFRQQLMENPELQEALEATLSEKGVRANLKDSPEDLQSSIDAFINGFTDGAVYKETHNLQRNPGKPSWAEEQQAAYQNRMAAVSEGELTLKQNQYNDAKDRQAKIDKLLYGENYDESTPPAGYYFDLSKDGEVTRIPDNHELVPGSNGTQIRKIETSNSGSGIVGEKITETEKNSIDKALLNLSGEQLSHNEGVTVKTNKNDYHYNWVGGISSNDGGTSWNFGLMGDRADEHTWAGKTHYNVVDSSNRYSAEGSDYGGWLKPWKHSRHFRILKQGEQETLPSDVQDKVQAVLKRGKYLTTEAVTDYIKANNLQNSGKSVNEVIQIMMTKGWKLPADVRIASIPQERGHRQNEDYLVLVREGGK